jgi:acetyl esterase/lipase
VIYYHGGGLCVGDLDRENLTCRRIVQELDCAVYSVDYRLMPDSTATDAFHDAMSAVSAIVRMKRAGKLILMGSSSGAQLAAMVSQRYNDSDSVQRVRQGKMIYGVLLRAPVTCDATEGRLNLPPRFRNFHTSMSPAFHTSLLSTPALTASNRTQEQLPLEGTVSGLPKHWI